MFNLTSAYHPKGDQPGAIDSLLEGLKRDEKYQTLLGVTGSGKTLTMANVIASVNRPTLVISHNKTLAAQLYSEFKEFFPENRVQYFVSYYDYYQPEAYIPSTDTYIQKDSSINDDIDRLRLAATSSLLSSRDVIIVASVSCIYPLGSPADYLSLMLRLRKEQEISRNDILKKLVEIQYERNELDLTRGKFRARGNIIELIPAYKEEGIRIELSETRVENLSVFDPLTGKKKEPKEEVIIYPAKHFVTTKSKIKTAISSIKKELTGQLQLLKNQGKLLEAQRLESRSKYDLEMLKEVGYCHGMENYSRHFSGRFSGERPEVLLDYFPKDFLLFIDESHVAVPQVKGMYLGDRSRKQTLIEYGFRLPSALDNRPLTYPEFDNLIKNVIFVSATPGKFEMERCEIKRLGEKSKNIAEQIIRPTGLLEPPVLIKPTKGQVDDLIARIRKRIADKERVLVITISRHMAEELADYLKGFGIKVEYIHYEVDTIKRVELLRNLREAKFDVLVGINLLREGLDLPEVSLVAILDADKEGFLRSETSLIQISGRAARSVNGQVIMYADNITKSMRLAINETNRRRKIQEDYNRKHHLTPVSIKKPIYKGIEEIIRSKKRFQGHSSLSEKEEKYLGKDVSAIIKRLQRQMFTAAKNLDYEKAAALRDRIKELKNEKP